MKNFLKKNYNFQNKNILITGGLGSIGYKLSKILYNENANLIITDNVKNKLKLRNKLRFFKNKNKIKYYNCDLSSFTEKKKIFEDIRKNHKIIDVLINNAALTGDRFEKLETHFEKQNNKIWSKELDVNLISVIEIIQNLKKNILKSKWPSIINLSSIYGIGKPQFQIYKNTNLNNQIGYSVSKAGIVQLTRWFSAYLAPKIRVNCITPGGIKRAQSKKFIESYSKLTLLNRMATDEDVISGILFLASKSSGYITGQNIIIDGGWSA